ncbi:MAG: glutamate-1-semialdehyde 2,1-aminomutase [Clostridia bacterium]
MQIKKSEALFERAEKVLPGGVNSPVRAFGAVGGTPRFIRAAKGTRLYDEDGNEYLDYLGSWGPMILGHNHPEIMAKIESVLHDGLSFGAATALEVEMAELMTSVVRPLEMVRMVSSGTEAVMSAIRLARGYTKRNKIIKFEGCYHGHCDAMLIKAGSGAMTTGNPDSAGVTPGAAQDTLLACYNDLSSVTECFDCHKGEVAAVIVEAVAANMGVVAPVDGFLQGLRKLCTENGTLLIFDEVITGFRLALGGAMEYYGIDADLATYGKIIGGGMPVGAYGGRREIMRCVSPIGSVYQAGTLSGNPVAMAAGLATVQKLRDNPAIYSTINALAGRLADGLTANTSCTVNHVGSLVCAFFTDRPVTDSRSAKASDVQAYARYFHHMLDSGIYVAPAQFEAMFLSAAHTQNDIDRTIAAARSFVG